MDTSAQEICFDAQGICNFCKEHEVKVLDAPFSKPDALQQLQALVEKIKAKASGEYDSIVGLSGGVDSSFVAYQAVKLGLKPLAVHFDNGWNSELAVKNIEELVNRLGLDLMTFVIDWEEFRDIQRSFFKAHVIDIELVTDHAIFAAMFQIAKKHGIRYILSGTNAATEGIMPRSWQHFKFDLRNLKAIHRAHGTQNIKKYPTIGIAGLAWNHYVAGFKSVSLLNYMRYNKTEAMQTLSSELGWKYYGGKHYESVFTKFYQAHILPQKFKVDKRRIHLSDLIMNAELTRDQALTELEKPLYSAEDLQRDSDYVRKKLGFSLEEFEQYLTAAPKPHSDYASDAVLAQHLLGWHRKLRYRTT